MFNSNPLLWRKPAVVSSYGIAVLSVSAALIISRLPSFHLQAAPVSLFLCAVMLTAWFGGAWPGLVATILSFLAFKYYFLEPLYSFALKSEEIPRAVLFLLSALFVGSLTVAQRSATESLRRARDDLKGTVQELERTNQALQAESGERQHAENKLRNSEQQWRDVFENNPTMYFIVDATGIVMAVNPFGAEQLGYDVDELVGHPVVGVFYELDREAAARNVALCLKQLGKSMSWELRKVRKDGAVIWVRETARAVIRADHPVVLIACEDITERKNAEDRLQRSEAYLAEAQRLSHTGSWAWAPAAGEIRYWSEECYRVLGFDSRGGLPPFEKFFQHIHPDDQSGSSETLSRATVEKAEFELDFRIVHLGGELRDIHVVGHPVLSLSGDLIEFVGTVMDVTERKRAEEERDRLRQAQADLARVNRVTAMGELTASLAHEVNQPIAAAVTDANTCVRWLMRDQPDLEEAREAASRTMKAATRAGEIINRVRLLFTKGTPQWEPVNLNEVIREMIILLRSETTRYSISVRTELAEDLPQVMGDRVQLQQVMMNLMINSIDAMKDVNGTRNLAIKSERSEDEQLMVSVSDTGLGLPAQQTDKIFNAFFSTKPHGTGMGLRISRSIVESHGGRLWAADKAPPGASFYLSLPIKAEVHK